MSEDLFVSIDDPVILRRSILEASKDAIKNLQEFEVFKEVRIKKVEHISELRRVIGEINKLNNQLSSLLPKGMTKKPEKKVEKKPEVKKVVKPKNSEIQKLEKELENIESKLSELG